MSTLGKHLRDEKMLAYDKYILKEVDFYSICQLSMPHMTMYLRLVVAYRASFRQV